MNTKWAQIHDGLAVTLILTGLLWGITLQFSVLAQQPSTQSVAANPATSATLRLENGKLETRNVGGSLKDSVNRWAAGTAKPAWLGYSVEEVKGDRSICCGHVGRAGSDGCGMCRLEGHNDGMNISRHDRETAAVRLEGPRELAVLFRAESGRISEIRIFSMECAVDAGGLSVIWLQGASASESVSFLETFVHGADMESAKSEKIGQSALRAIALHADPTADRAMESFTAAEEPVSLRRETAFWLGEARSAEGLRILLKMSHSDPSPNVREQVTFGLSVSNEPGALPEMIRMAREDKSAEVRGQALFWLGQKAGEKASKAITGSIDNDPDTDVKKKAVFALSQMPAEQGVPKLIQVAQSNRNPEVRKEAMFWLGQSEDPQALAFFEKVLSQ